MARAAYNVRPCDPAYRDVALRTLHAGLPAEKQDELVLVLSQAPLTDEAYWRGLLMAGSVADPAGAAWLQPLPGNFAVYWPPAASSPAARELFRAVGEVADAQRWPLVQLLAREDDEWNAELLEAGQFVRLARLDYMAVEPRREAAADGVEFVDRAGEHPRRLASLLEQTFVGTRDCPQLEGLRDLGDTVAGYRAQGAHDPALWYILRTAEQDAGVLLLTRHPASGNWELIYMGIVPEFRGMGLGQRIVRYAIDAAYRDQAAQLVLAVDAENRPALKIYHAAGFRAWDRQTVYGRLAFPQNSS